MPRVVITFDPEHHEYFVTPFQGQTINPEYEVVMDMKSSHYRNMMKNRARYVNDLDTLRKFFLEGQLSGRTIRER